MGADIAYFRHAEIFANFHWNTIRLSKYVIETSSPGSMTAIGHQFAGTSLRFMGTQSLAKLCTRRYFHYPHLVTATYSVCVTVTLQRSEREMEMNLASLQADPKVQCQNQYVTVLEDYRIANVLLL